MKIGDKSLSKCRKSEIVEYVENTMSILNKYLGLDGKPLLFIENQDKLDIKELSEIARWLDKRRDSELADCVGIRRSCSEEVWERMKTLGNAGMWEVREMKSAFAALNKTVYSMPRPKVIKVSKEKK